MGGGSSGLRVFPCFGAPPVDPQGPSPARRNDPESRRKEEARAGPSSNLAQQSPAAQGSGRRGRVSPGLDPPDPNKADTEHESKIQSKPLSRKPSFESGMLAVEPLTPAPRSREGSFATTHAPNIHAAQRQKLEAARELAAQAVADRKDSSRERPGANAGPSAPPPADEEREEAADAGGNTERDLFMKKIDERFERWLRKDALECIYEARGQIIPPWEEADAGASLARSPSRKSIQAGSSSQRGGGGLALDRSQSQPLRKSIDGQSAPDN
eukprot:tig00021357_g20770.t1